MRTMSPTNIIAPPAAEPAIISKIMKKGKFFFDNSNQNAAEIKCS